MAGPRWLPDGEHMLCLLAPEDQGDEPAPAKVTVGPNIQESYGQTSPTRTYQDLLQNGHDEALFEHYATTQLSIVGVDGSVKPIGKPKMYTGMAPSPSGDYVLTTNLKKPFSYLMTYRSFPRDIAVQKINPDSSGPNSFVVANIPMDENIPIEGVRTGPRNINWKSSTEATLIWNEALDGGDPSVEIPFRDSYMTLAAPFDETPQELLKVQHRAYGISFFADPSIVTTTELTGIDEGANAIA